MIGQKHRLLLIFLTAIVTSPILLSEIEHHKPKTSLVAAQTPPTATANVPAQPFLPTPGWLGLATVPGGGRPRYSWSPSHPNGQVVIVSDVEAWSRVRASTPIVAVTTGFKQKMTFLRSSQERYGCDGIPTPMAAFSAPRRPPEGVVWLLPERDAQTATAIGVQKIPLAQVPAALLPRPLPRNSDARAWRAGSIVILQRKQSAYKVKMTVANNSRVIFSKVEEKSFFSSDNNRPPINLATANGEPGISEPLNTFQLKAGAVPVVVFWQPGYEGNGFSIVASDGRMVKEYEGGSLYFCAY